MTIRQSILARQRPDTPADIAWRVRAQAAGRQAHEETMARFKAITPENIREALKFQEDRIQDLMRATAGQS